MGEIIVEFLKALIGEKSHWENKTSFDGEKTWIINREIFAKKEFRIKN